MLHVTQRALEELEIALGEQCVEPRERLGFRILAVRAPSGPDANDPDSPNEAFLELALDEPGRDDEVVACGNRPILIMARPLAAFLDGFRVDVFETIDGARHIALEMPGGFA